LTSGIIPSSRRRTSFCPSEAKKKKGKENQESENKQLSIFQTKN
jgi:hypothetical protein